MYYVISVRPVLQTEAKTGPFHFLFVDSLTPFFTIPYSWVRFLLSARRKQDTHLGTLRASTDNSQKQVWKYQVTVGKSQIYFLYLCCKVSFTLSFPCNNQIIFFPTLKSLSPSYIKSRGTDSALYPSPPTLEIWSSSIKFNEFAQDLHWCNWSKSGPAIWTAVPMATGSRFRSINLQAEVCFSLKGETPAFSFQPWGENVGYIWSASPGLYFWLYQWTLGKIASHCRSFPSSSMGIILHRSVLKIDSAF